MIELIAAIAIAASAVAAPAPSAARPAAATCPTSGTQGAGALHPRRRVVHAQAQSSAETRNEQIIAQAFDRWAAGGTGFFQEVLSPDVVWTIKGSGPSAGVFRGRQDFIDRAVTPFSSRLSTPVRPTVRDIWSEGDQVVVHWDGEATARDGRAYRNSYVWIFRMRGGRASDVIAYLDLAPYDDVLRRIPAR